MIRNSLNKSNGSNEKTLAEIFHIIYTRKWIIIISIVSALTLAFLYNVIATPVYESTVILKKELANKKNLNNDLMEIVMMQTQDEVETEMELVKTVEVLSKVVEELNLIVQYDAIITPEGEFIELDNPELEYSNPSLDIDIHLFPLPKVSG